MAFDAIMMVHGWTHMRSKAQDFNLKLEKICEHIDHVCQIAGNAKHVGIGTDLDGGFGNERRRWIWTVSLTFIRSWPPSRRGAIRRKTLITSSAAISWVSCASTCGEANRRPLRCARGRHG